MKINLNFNPQNIVPKGVRSIGLYDSDGNKLRNIPLGNLAPKSIGNILYTFGALSDVHLPYKTAKDDFIRALNYFNNTEKVDFICIAGDMSDTGTAAEWADYKTHVDTYSPNTPVHISAGNHDATNGLTYEYPRQYTGNPLYYSFEQGNDIFIIFGLWGWDGSYFATQSLQWLYETLEKNRNKRCFVFQHIMRKNYSGDAAGIYGWDGLNNTKGKVFLSLMEHYKNVLWFHGHSHCEFEHQETMLKENANYDRLFGCHSIHIPSCAATRNENNVYEYEDSEGYVVDVYENGVHLRGRDFIAEKFLPIASYWIDTTPRTIIAGSYTDSTGTIKTGSSTPSEPSGEITLPENSELSLNYRYSESNECIVNGDKCKGMFSVFVPIEDADGASKFVLRVENLPIPITSVFSTEGTNLDNSTILLVDGNKKDPDRIGVSNVIGELKSGVTEYDNQRTAEIEFIPAADRKYVALTIRIKRTATSITENDIKNIIITLEKVENESSEITLPENSELILSKRFSGSKNTMIDSNSPGVFSTIIPIDTDGTSEFILKIENLPISITKKWESPSTLDNHTLYLLNENKQDARNAEGELPSEGIGSIIGELQDGMVTDNGTSAEIKFVPAEDRKYIALTIRVNETGTAITEDDIKDIIITLEKKELVISENSIVNIPGILYNQRCSQSSGGMSTSSATGMFTFALQVEPGTEYCLSFEGLPLPLNKSVTGTSNHVLYGLKSYNPIGTIHTVVGSNSNIKDMGSNATANSVTFTTSSSTPTNYIIVSIAVTNGTSISASDVEHITYKLEKI